MNKKILVVEDEPGILVSLADELESEGYAVLTAGRGDKALEIAEERNPDLIILDIMLPVLDGYEVCKRLRMAGNTTPIIMLTVRDKEVDKILGLELGADDYVTKPFSLRELTARVKAIFRRMEQAPKDPAQYKFGNVKLDFQRYEATRKGKELVMTHLEFQMLKLLITKKGCVVSRNDFLDHIWGEDNVSVSSRTIDSHIANIRKKIEDDPAHPKHILSLRSAGYKFVD
jgi:two-component system alkaline phosphatase synthesis response regulator PhoP